MFLFFDNIFIGICSILFTSNIFFYSRQAYDNDFTKSDCYESISFPKKFIELSHFYPVGPQLLFSIVNFRIYSSTNESQSTEILQKLHFKRINKQCTHSIVFSTIGLEFKKIDIEIEIYLFESHDIISNIYYEFGYNFIPGLYLLRDIYSNFGVIIEILKYGEKQTQNYSDLFDKERFYLSSLSTEKSYLCVVTENNRALVLKPIYNYQIPNGFCTNIFIHFMYNNFIMESIKLPAFECHVEEEKPDDFIIIDDQHENDILFNVLCLKFEVDNNSEINYPFLLSNIRRESIYNYWNLSQNYKIVFMIQSRTYPINCRDGTKRIRFVSKTGIPYYEIEITEINIAQDVNRYQRIVHNPLIQC